MKIQSRRVMKFFELMRNNEIQQEKNGGERQVRQVGAGGLLRLEIYMGVEPKIGVFPPKSSMCS